MEARRKLLRFGEELHSEGGLMKFFLSWIGWSIPWASFLHSFLHKISALSLKFSNLNSIQAILENKQHFKTIY